MNVIGFKKAKCKNCYKCVRTCEVKAIIVKNQQAQILNNKCILCGHCLDTCPQNAKTLISDLEEVKNWISNGAKVVLSIAPSYLVLYSKVAPGKLVTVLKRLGFYQVRETAEGAAYVTEKYNQLLQQNEMKNIITTCCPSVNDLIEIYYPTLTKYMAPVVSPMIAHGKIIKHQLGKEVKVVFLGPCISKKREALSDQRTIGAIDAVINFQEINDWIQEEGIMVNQCEESRFDNPDPKVNRLYPVSSGVLSAVVASNVKDTYRKFYVHGISNCIELLKSMEKGEICNSFIEMNICNGGCVKGPAVDTKNISRFKAKLDLEEQIPKQKMIHNIPQNINDSVDISKKFYSREGKERIPSDDEVRTILKKIGKFDYSDELNCGACGYSSCREKAIAVYQGKAELTMCIPYMSDRAQSMANIVLDTTPNAIIMVDSEMKIVEFNQAAQILFHKSKQEVKKCYLYEFIDHSDFEYVLETHCNITGKKIEYEECNITLLESIIYVKEENNVLGIFQDISKEVEQEQQAYNVKMNTIEMAQKVIDKQMMVAQKIAGLLGETTAETKMTLTKLRDTILYNESQSEEK